METRQLEHEGFEHTDEFRQVKLEETYQDQHGYPTKHCIPFGLEAMKLHGGKRWILRKKPVLKKCPQCGLVYGSPHGNEPCPRSFVVGEYVDQKRVEELENELAADEATRELQRKRIKQLDEDLEKAKAAINNLLYNTETVEATNLLYRLRQPKQTDTAS